MLEGFANQQPARNSARTTVEGRGNHLTFSILSTG
jgi:hypothetical protein